jgi:hypothetical protein
MAAQNPPFVTHRRYFPNANGLWLHGFPLAMSPMSPMSPMSQSWVGRAKRWYTQRRLRSMPSWHLVCPKLLSVETLVTGSHEGIDDIYHKSLGFSYQVQHLEQFIVLNQRTHCLWMMTFNRSRVQKIRKGLVQVMFDLNELRCMSKMVWNDPVHTHIYYIYICVYIYVPIYVSIYLSLPSCLHICI